MFELHLIGDIHKVDGIDIRCINCKKETCLYLRTSTFEEMITKFFKCNIASCGYVVDNQLQPRNEI